jgi:hypothetical protein
MPLAGSNEAADAVCRTPSSTVALPQLIGKIKDIMMDFPKVVDGIF